MATTLQPTCRVRRAEEQFPERFQLDSCSSLIGRKEGHHDISGEGCKRKRQTDRWTKNLFFLMDTAHRSSKPVVPGLLLHRQVVACETLQHCSQLWKIKELYVRLTRRVKHYVACSVRTLTYLSVGFKITANTLSDSANNRYRFSARKSDSYTNLWVPHGICPT